MLRSVAMDYAATILDEVGGILKDRIKKSAGK
jgi:hypothetical protein